MKMYWREVPQRVLPNHYPSSNEAVKEAAPGVGTQAQEQLLQPAVLGALSLLPGGAAGTSAARRTQRPAAGTCHHATLSHAKALTSTHFSPSKRPG